MVIILVVLTFVAFAFVYPLVMKQREKKFLENLGIAEPVLPDLMITPEHLWLSRLQSGIFYLGLDELVLRFVGDPDKIQLAKGGERVKAGEPLAILTKGDKELYVRASAEVTIIKTNRYLTRRPQTLNHDPYRRGWLYQVELADQGRRFGTLLTGDKAMSWIKKELALLKEFAVRRQSEPALAGATLLDGGELIEGVIDHLDQAAVREFEKRFLTIELHQQAEEKK